jgi:hypothetical protein
MDQNPPPPPSWSPTPPPPDPQNSPGLTSSPPPPPPPDPSTAWPQGATAPPPPPAAGDPYDQSAPTQAAQPGQYAAPPNAFQTPSAPNGPNKAGWKIPAAIGAAVVLVGIGAFAAVGKLSKKSASAVTTTINSTSAPTTEVPTTTRTRLTTTVAETTPESTDPASPTTSGGASGAAGMTSLQFAGLKSVIRQIAQVDISPYEECVRDAPYTLQMTDATMLVCIEDPVERTQYIKAALGRAEGLKDSPAEFLACYEAAITKDEFITRLANPTGTGAEADTYAIDQFTGAGLACRAPS